MQFLGLCDFKVSHTFLTKLNEALNLQIPLMQLVWHDQSTLCKSSSRVNLKEAHSAPFRFVYNCKFLIVIPIVDLLTDLDFWIAVDATRIIIIRLWTISVAEKKKKEDKNQS